jgi:hypothetical protein
MYFFTGCHSNISYRKYTEPLQRREELHVPISKQSGETWHYYITHNTGNEWIWENELSIFIEVATTL